MLCMDSTVYKMTSAVCYAHHVLPILVAGFAMIFMLDEIGDY